MKLKFTKMHGTGNDYIYVNGFTQKIEDPESAAIKLSKPHFYIGSDGLIIVAPSDVAVTNCLKFLIRLSPATKMPGILV